MLDFRYGSTSTEIRCLRHVRSALWRLGRDEPHVRSGDRLANRVGVSGIVLMPLHISRRHQANGVATRLQLARPMMRRGAGLDTDQARWQLHEEGQHVAALELSAENHIALRIDTVDLKNRLRDVETNLSKPFAWVAPPNRGSLNQRPHLWHSRAGGGAVHSIKTGLMHCTNRVGETSPFTGTRRFPRPP
jgi:hypothetical protein